MPYATGAEFLSRYDVRLIGDLVRDDGAQETATLVPTNPNLTACLDDASAAIDAALVVGSRYTPAQLAGELSVSAAAFLRRLTCDMTLIFLKRRRGRFDPERDGALLKEVNETLQSLRDGNNLLMLEDETEAPASTIDLVTPELIPICRRNTIRARTRNYYPLPRDSRNGCCE